MYTFMSCLTAYHFFYPLLNANEVIVSLGIHPFDICQKNILVWNFLKTSFWFIYISANFIIFDLLENKFVEILNSLNNFKFINKNSIFIKNDNNNFINNINNKNIELLIGKNINSNKNIIIPESGLYQNFLILKLLLKPH